MKRVYADIAGDLFHHGHVEFFKKLHDDGKNHLIVGLHSDKDIFAYKQKTPILTITERKKLIESCRYVDEVWIDTPVYLTKEYLTEHKIDVVSHAHDADDIKYNEYYKVPIEMGIFLRLDYSHDISSTDIINRILKRYNP